MLKAIKRNITSTLIAFSLLVSTGALVFADSWNYYLTFTVTDNTSTAREYLPILTGIKSSTFISTGYLNSSGNETRLTESGTDRGYGVSGNISLVIPSLSALQSREYRFYMGYTPAVSQSIIIGYNGAKITTADNAALELGDNFTVSLSGYWNTDNGNNKYSVNKTGAVMMFVSPTVSGNITTYLYADTVGSAAINRGSSLAAGFTTIDLSNSASHDGIIVKLEVWATTNITALRVGSFYNVGGSDYKCRDSQLLGSVTAGAKVTFDTTILIEIGDYIGCYYTAGSLELDTAGGTAATFVGEAIDPDDQATYTSQTYIPSLYGATAISLTATGVASGIHTVDLMAAPLIWTTSDVLDFTQGVNSNINCGAIYNSQPSLWTSLWFKLDANFASGAPGSMYLFGKYQAATDFVRVRLENTDGRLEFRKDVGGVNAFIIYGRNAAGAWITSWTADQWYHVLFSTNPVRFIVDNGTVVTDADISFTPAGGNFMIGEFYTAAGSGLTGNIANIVVGTDNLTVGEEAGLYLGNTPGDETDLWYIDESTGTGIISYGSAANNGTAGVVTSWDTDIRPCKLALLIDFSGNGYVKPVSVTDSANDFLWMQNNVLPYADNISITVGGIRKLLYAPNSMIVGTNLPNRESASYNGTITWGSNPAGLEISIGEITSYESTTIEEYTTTGVSNTVDTLEQPSGWYGSDAEPTNLPFYDTFYAKATEMGMPTTSLYLIMMVGVAAAVGLSVLLFTGSIFLLIAILAAVLMFAADTGVISGWFVLAFIILAVPTWYLSRQT